MHIDHQQPSEIKGILAWIERTEIDCLIPFLSFYCIAAVVLVSVILAAIGVSAVHPTQVDEFGNAIASMQKAFSRRIISNAYWLTCLRHLQAFIHSATCWSLCWERGC